jgi:hypothetical protein
MAKPTKRRKSDDMLDPQTEIEQYGELRRFLIACEPVFKGFTDAERKALRFQARYRWNALIAAWSGTSAIVIAVVLMLLTRPDHSTVLLRVLTFLEFIAVAAALVVVVSGELRSDKKQWLIERNRAERCRLLKFQILTDSKIWTGDKSIESYGTVDGPLADIQSRDKDGLWEWIERDPPPQCVTISSQVSWKSLETLVAYYRKRRLEFQMKYLAETGRRCEEKYWPRRHDFSLYFYASIFFVFFHLIAEFAEHLEGHGGSSQQLTPVGVLSLIFLAFAVALPAIGTGVRTKHLADELARNASRYKAKHYALQQLQARLSRAVEAQDAEAVLRELSSCEQVLELDQREWLRLMIEAEWY